MNRKYTKEEYVEKVKKLKQAVPGISITTDIIVGFRETNEDFEKTLELVKECNLKAFTFIFSPREGTPAIVMKIPLQWKKKKKTLYRFKIVNEGYLKEINVLREK